MKTKILVTVIAVITAMQCKSQAWKWESVDSIPKTKNELYSDVKQIIAESWKSSTAVIQNDDKDGGIVLIKGLTQEHGLTSVINWVGYTYRYNVTFMMKDGKYRIIIDNVHCESSYYGQNRFSTRCIEPFDGDNYERESSSDMPPKKVIPMMKEVKDEINTLFNYLINEINKPSKNSEW